MILKFDSDHEEVYLLEATGNRGVALNKWEYLRPHVGEDKFYTKLVLRHIDFDRSDKMIDNLEQFLKEVLGKKYGLNVEKLKRRQTVAFSGSEKEPDRKLINEDRTFFCSELVAKACKVLGILKNTDVSCGRFMPGDFSARASFLNPTDGTLIGEEQRIIVIDKPNEEAIWDAKLDEEMDK